MKSYWQPDLAADLRIPVAKPRLPGCEEISPYLRRIDQSGWYSNGGPLVQELEDRLAEHAGGGAARVATVTNATIGLALALLSYDPPPGSLCVVPAWTFAATAHAVLLAGLIPWIVDVDETTWALEPSPMRKLLGSAPGTVAAIIPVSPFGAPLDSAAWEAFRDETGVAVVIDAAATFDTIRASHVPAVVSLHATKVLGIGEGGFIVSMDDRFIEEVQKRANFGFWNSREATARSLNGKLSEYAAAVGLAALDAWPEIRRDFERVARAYRASLSHQHTVRLQPGVGDDWVTSTTVVATPEGQAEAVARALAEKQIGSRRWWGGGLHRHQAFSHLPRHHTAHSDFLVDSTIGLPCWRDLSNDEIARICAIVCSVSG